MAATVQGVCDPRFEGVQRVFEKSFETGEVGAAVAITQGGELGPNATTFGHAGAGGSIAYADPEARVGFAYVMNQMQGGTTGDPRGFRLIGALYRSLAG